MKRTAKSPLATLLSPGGKPTSRVRKLPPRADCSSVESDFVHAVLDRVAALHRAFLRNARLTTGYGARPQLPRQRKRNLL
jgi:hypothetical protein